MLQRILPPDVLGRVFGIFDSLTVAGILIGSLLAPVIVAVFGLQAALVLAGSLLVVFTLLVLPRARNIDRKAAARVGELRPRVESLERLGIFEAASPQTLEALAASLTEEVVSAGEVVIREGDPPDDLFVIVSGTLDVTSAGGVRPEPEKVGELGPGDYFGEIGLLRKVPRTATVAATSRCRLYRIAGDDFLRIVTEGPRLSANLLAGVTTRMARTEPWEELGHS
jgi:hypothetical protein